ncbi:phage minor head protein [Cupriavidus sp. H19C3]|uniref:phage head morphogenesis protein n=1 Tax=Cupriavidus sp. H19C3 TaxID=3241603 RepID=UPI003BF77D72
MKTSGPERLYRTQLRQVARQVGGLVNGFPPGDPAALPTIEQVLRAYAEALTPWAAATAQTMLREVNRRDEAAWAEYTRELSRALRTEIRTAPTGAAMQALLAEQVTLIKSIPLDAAQRVHRLTLEGIENSTRASAISKEIQRSGEVAESRADLIARTEVGRTASTLTEARALHVGSEGYIWRTSGDSDVREDHRELEGKFIRWDSPPIADKRTGRRAHAGCIYGCRCYPEPVIPED